MKKRLQGFVAGVLSVLVVSGVYALAKNATEIIEVTYNNIKIVMDGKEYSPTDANGNTVEPFIYNGTTYLPVRAVANAVGKEVKWDGDTYTVHLNTPGFDSTGDTENPYETDIMTVFNGVNENRKAAGLKELALDENLCKAASFRAKELVSAFSHARPNGESCFTVLPMYDIKYSSAGENIASGYRTGDAVLRGWLNSDGHRANIMSSAFTKIGIGVYESGNKLYWVQIFIG